MDQQGIGVRQDLPNGIVDPGRCRNGGVAQRVVVDIFVAHDGSPAAAVFKQVTDTGPVSTRA